jgi:hypothetical protein
VPPFCPSHELPEPWLEFSAAAVDSSIPPPLRRRGTAQEPRKEVRIILALLVVVPVLHTARSRSPEFAAAPSRAAAWSVIALVSLPSAPP